MSNDDKEYEYLVRLALAMYANEPCRICGELIRPEDLNDAVFAGYSKYNESRAAHGQCWESKTPISEWAYP